MVNVLLCNGNYFYVDVDWVSVTYVGLMDTRYNIYERQIRSR